MNLTPEQLAKCGPDHPIHNILQRMNLIEEKMRAADPEIGTHLKAIWKECQQYEELAHLLTPEQIGSLMKAVQKHTAITLVVEDAGKKTKSKSVKYGVDDLI